MPLQDVTNTHLITPIKFNKPSSHRKSSCSSDRDVNENNELDDSHILNRWKESMMELKSTLEQEELITAKTPSPLRFLPPGTTPKSSSSSSRSREYVKTETPPPSAIVFRRAVTSACDTVSRSRFRSGLRRLIPILRRNRFSSLDQSFARWNQYVRIAAIKDRLENENGDDLAQDEDIYEDEDSLPLPTFSPAAKRSLNMNQQEQKQHQQDNITTPLIHREALEDIKDFASTIRAEARQLYPSPECESKTTKKIEEKSFSSWTWSSALISVSYLADFLLKIVIVVLMSTYLYVGPGGLYSSSTMMVVPLDSKSLVDSTNNNVARVMSSSLSRTVSSPFVVSPPSSPRSRQYHQEQSKNATTKTRVVLKEKLNVVSPKERTVFSTGETPTIELAFGPEIQSKGKQFKLCLSLFRLGFNRGGHRGKSPERTWDSCFMVDTSESVTKFVPPRFFQGEYELRAVLLDRKILARPKIQFYVARQRTSVTVHVRGSRVS